MSFLPNERTNYVWFPKIAHEKQWAVAVISWWTLDGCCCLLVNMQILKHTEQIAHKFFVQNLNCRSSSLYNPPPPRYMTGMAYEISHGVSSIAPSARFPTQHTTTETAVRQIKGKSTVESTTCLPPSQATGGWERGGPGGALQGESDRCFGSEGDLEWCPEADMEAVGGGCCAVVRSRSVGHDYFLACE